MSDVPTKRALRLCELPGCDKPKVFVLCKEHLDKLTDELRQEMYAAWEGQKAPTKRWMRARYNAVESVNPQ